MIYRLILLITCSIAIHVGQDNFHPWNDGPYGTNYFDIAGQFIIPEIEATIPGDTNDDNIINIQDIIQIIGYILFINEFTDDQFEVADINDDGEVNILDITILVEMILDGVIAGWNFEMEWTGYESYIFIHYSPSVPNSTSLWLSDTKEALLNNSPMNVHYFFLSSRSVAENDAEAMENVFNDILNEMPDELADHWRSHLHFCPVRLPELNSWIAEKLVDKYALGIDRFQRIKQIGYLGNPASFSGTHMSYLAHEALYYEYEHQVLYEPEAEYDELVIFDQEVYSGGWYHSITQEVEFPSNEELDNYDKIQIELLRGCPDANGNYDDAACDDYDRIAHLYMCEEGGENCLEISRWITPFDRQPHSIMDITSFMSLIKPGGVRTIKYLESGFPNSLLTIKLRFFNEIEDSITPQEYQPMWLGTVQFNPDYGENRPPMIFDVPENAVKVEFAAYLTGHGWGSAGCFNCCEFCNTRHLFILNGGIYTFEKEHPEAGDLDYCMEPETISQGVVPNQFGTWGYGRAGWCPGMDVEPYIVDITEFIEVGEENVLEYDACRVDGANCVEPPTCLGDGYCPEIALSSYIIIWY